MTKKHQHPRKKTILAYSMRIIIPEKRMGVIQSIINVDIVECAVAKFIIFSLIVSAWLSATFRFVDPREIFFRIDFPFSVFTAVKVLVACFSSLT